MNPLPDTLYRAAQSRELDRIAIEDFHIPGYALMQRAGQAVHALIARRWPAAQRWLVVAGPGNNGGDGYVVARLALLAGHGVHVLAVGDPARIAGDAAQAREDYLRAGGQEDPLAGDGLPECELIVDALFGTGLQREVQGPLRTLVEAMNRHPAPVVAIDIPSGLHADRGVALGVAVRATATLTFIALKQGLLTGQGPDHCGELHYDGLGVPQAVYTRVPPSGHRAHLDRYASALAPRPRTSHKGHFGHVLVIGGETGMTGAARMASEAAARTGAGLVSIATRPDHCAYLNAGCPVLMVHGVENAADLGPLVDRATVIAVGPGLGTSPWARGLLEVATSSGRPLVLDADALNLLARGPSAAEQRILTPHPGEAARLLDTDTHTVQSDRFAAARRLRERYGGVVVLKGAGTLIQSEQGVAVCTGGNPGMASGGMGDVLTGIIAGLVAQGIELARAAELGVSLHAAAADSAARDGERGLLATDLFAGLRPLLNPTRHRSGPDSP